MRGPHRHCLQPDSRFRSARYPITRCFWVVQTHNKQTDDVNGVTVHDRRIIARRLLLGCIYPSLNTSSSSAQLQPLVMLCFAARGEFVVCRFCPPPGFPSPATRTASCPAKFGPAWASLQRRCVKCGRVHPGLKSAAIWCDTIWHGKTITYIR